MNRTKWLLAIALADLSILNAYGLYQFGLSGFMELVTANVVTVSVLVDLTIALTLVAVWMGNDAKARGISVLPYYVLTVTLGSIGPLLYLLRVANRRAPILAPARQPVEAATY